MWPLCSCKKKNDMKWIKSVSRALTADGQLKIPNRKYLANVELEFNHKKRWR